MKEQEILDLIKKSDASDLQALLTAKESAKRNMLDDPSQPNVNAFMAAQKALDAFKADPHDDQIVFGNRLEVLGHLKKQGYKIGKTKLYQDCKIGMLRLQDDGSVLEKDLERYIKRAGLIKLEDLSTDSIDHIAREKAQMELTKIQEQINDLRFKREVSEGRYIPRNQFEIELASRAVVLEAGFRHLFQANITGWVELVGGDLKKVPQLLQQLNQALDEQLNQFASMKHFQVIFIDEQNVTAD